MKTVLAIAAHPDDIEFLMAGTLLRLRDAGYRIHYWNLANGCCGSTQHDAAATARIRREEARAAAEALGAVFHESLCNDLEVFYNLPLLAQVAAGMREAAPEIVLTHAPVDYMEDHTNTCRLAVTAAFARGMPNFPVHPPRAAVSNQVTVYHAQPYSHHEPLGRFVMPDLVVDVGDLQLQKRALLARHVSQKAWLDQSQGLDSYLDTLTALDAQLGERTGRFTHAEGWRRHLHMGFCSPHDDPLAAALGPKVQRPAASAGP